MTWILSRALLAGFVDSANSPSSPEQAAEFSEGRYSAGRQFAQSNGSLTPQAFLFKGKTTASSPPSLSGMTCRRLREPVGEAVLTWFLEAFLARTSAPQERALASPVRAQDYGVRWRELSARWNHDMSSWKTRPSLWDEGWTLSLGTLPRWGLMRDGALWERVMLVRRTNETESGFLPTPVKYDSHGTWASNNYHGLGWSAKNDLTNLAGRGRRMLPTPVKNEDRASKYTIETSFKHYTDGSHQVHLAQVARDPRMHPQPAQEPLQGLVRRFPTPTAQDGDPKRSKRPPPRVRMTRSGLPEADRPSGSGAQLTLMQAAVIKDRQQLPTPGAQNGLHGGSNSEHRPNKWQQPGHPEYGELSAEWTEWIMGWPIGWTSLEPLDRRAYEHWFELMSAHPDTGYGLWWVQDPSEVPDSGITKTVVPKDKADDLVRISRIAALGNGQVSAVIPAVKLILLTMETPQE